MPKQAIKAITSVPGWVDRLEAADKIEGTAQAYAAVPLVFRALRLRCDSLSSVPVKITKLRGTSDIGWPFPTPLPDLIWRTEAALQMTGAAYWLIKRNTVRVLDAEWLNPTTISIAKDAAGNRIYRQTIGASTQDYAEDEIVFFNEFDLLTDTGPGIGALEVALGDSKLMHYMTRFTAHFFEGGAQPIMLVGVEGNPPQSEIDRLQNRLRRAMQGLSNVFRVLALRAGLKPVPITPPLDTLVMDKLKAASVENIAWAFGIPKTMLLDAANRATAEQHDLQFWQTAIRPRGGLYAGAINRQLLNPLGMRIEFAFEDLDVFQADEADRAVSLGQLVTAGVPLNIAMDILGYDLDPEQMAVIEEISSTPEPAPVIVQADPTADPTADQKGLRFEMGAWERKALKRAKAGKEPLCGFESASIPPALAGAVEGSLAAVGRNPGLIRAVFADAATWGAAHV